LIPAQIYYVLMT